jgi:hypothetical protein
MFLWIPLLWFWSIAESYSAQLAQVMKKLILVSEVAYLSSKVKHHGSEIVMPRHLQSLENAYGGDVELSMGGAPENPIPNVAEGDGSGKVRASSTGSAFRSSSKIAIFEMLEGWEEPELVEDEDVSKNVQLLCLTVHFAAYLSSSSTA